MNEPTSKEYIEETLSELRRDLAENGDRVVMYVPYIPLMISGVTDPIPSEIFFESRYYGNLTPVDIEKINASPERYIRLSDMIRNLRGLLRIMNE